MKSISVPSILRVGLLICSISTALAQELVDAGCYSSSEPLKDQGLYTFQSSGYCKDQCVKLLKPVMALSKGSNCYCGDYIPVASNRVPDSKCNTKCNGYPQETCGGLGYFGVKLTGLDPAVGNYKPDSSSISTTISSSSSSSSPSPTSGSTSPTPTSSVVVPPSTIVVTPSPEKTSASQSATPDPGSKTASTAGIAAGVVVGLVAVISIAGGVYFFLRNRKRRALEAEFHRNNANAFLEGAKAPDARLDPSVMMQRRQSDGSIADNRDYSRRILKVTNPDGT